MSSKYRIKLGEAYNGMFPATVYMVQVRKDGFFGSKWENVKGFFDKKKATDLLKILDNKK